MPGASRRRDFLKTTNSAACRATATARTAGKKRRGTGNSRGVIAGTRASACENYFSARHEQQRPLRFVEQRGRGVAEEKSFARSAADAEHHQIVIAALELGEDRLVGGPLRYDRCADTNVVTVRDCNDVLEDGLFMAAAARNGSPVGRTHRHVEDSDFRLCRARQGDSNLRPAPRRR